MGDAEWQDGPKMTTEQRLRFIAARAELRAATAELASARNALQLWVMQSREAAPLLQAIDRAESALEKAGAAANDVRQQLELELGVDLRDAQVNVDTGEVRIRNVEG